MSGSDLGEIEAVVRELLLAHLEPPARNDAPLELPSLSLVSFAEELEQEMGFIVAARDLVPENFATIGSIVEYAARRLGGA